MIDTPLISVVIPIYNTEAYLDRCISSVVNQTYRNLEIILVDDGSTDGCPFICDEWAKKDDRIRVIHKENGGAADAKNVGLDAATGELIAIVDSDDVIADIMYEKLLQLMKDHEADIADSLAEKTFSSGNVEFICKNDAKVYEFTPEEALSGDRKSVV